MPEDVVDVGTGSPANVRRQIVRMCAVRREAMRREDGDARLVQVPHQLEAHPLGVRVSSAGSTMCRDIWVGRR